MRHQVVTRRGNFCSVAVHFALFDGDCSLIALLSTQLLH